MENITENKETIGPAILAKDYIRVGDDYYKKSLRPDKNGKLHSILAKRQHCGT
jgi:hypothetical protein